MLKSRRWQSIVLLCVASLSFFSCAQAQSRKDTLTVSVLSFNDFHGNLLPSGQRVPVRDPKTGQIVTLSAGGMAYLHALVKDLEAENPGKTILVATGDLIGASPPESGLFHDEPAIEAMNLLGLAVSSVGNHEFDRGKDEILRIQHGGCYPPTEDGKQGIVGEDTCMDNGKFSGATFQYLAANVIDRQTGKPLFPAYAIRNVGGVKIAFVGVTLKGMPAVVIPSGVSGLRFVDEAKTVNRLVPELKKQGADIIVVLLHQGAQVARNALANASNDSSCTHLKGWALDIADRMDPAVKVVITGHTHKAYACRRHGKLLTQAGRYGSMLTKIDLVLDANTHSVVDMQARNHVVVNSGKARTEDGQYLPLPAGFHQPKKDPAMDKLVQRYADLTRTQEKTVIAEIGGFLDRTKNPAGESTLGRVVADAYLAATSDPAYPGGAAQIAFVNPGAMRSNLNKRLRVTASDAYRVLPFMNHLVTMTLTGAQIKRLLEQQWARAQPPGGRVLAVSQGFTYTWDARQHARAIHGKGHRVLAGSMKLHGVPLMPAQTYRVTVNSFLSAGGDRFTVFNEGEKVQAGVQDREALEKFLHAHSPLPVPSSERIRRIH